MIADVQTIGDVINAIAAIAEPLDGTVSEDGLTVQLGNQLVRIGFTPIHPRTTRRDCVEGYDGLASAIRGYDDARRSS